MRRLYLSVVSLGLLTAVVGCGHLHGVCDCDQRGPCGTYGSCPCYGHGELNMDHGPVTNAPVGAGYMAPVGTPVAPVAPIAPVPGPIPVPISAAPRL